MKQRKTMAHLTALGLCAGAALGIAPAAFAQPEIVDGVEATGEVDPASPPIPPYVEQEAVASPNGGFCYVGPHPVDTRVEPGPAWDPGQGAHLHAYAPIDLRLFTYREGCYYFIGDPADFGYRGTSYQYYGAHPILDNYGGGWCFMIGGHSHLWQPWSSSFVVMGPWFYWNGAYDPYFWSYWPYYSFYYRSYYPHYYGGGRFYRTRDFHVAPPIRRVPAAVAGRNWRGGGNGWNGAPQGSWRGAPPAAAVPQGGQGHVWRGSSPGTPAAPTPTWTAHPTSGGWQGRPTGNTWTAHPTTAAPSWSNRPAPSGGNTWTAHPMPTRSAPPSSFHSAPAPSSHSAPVHRSAPAAAHRR